MPGRQSCLVKTKLRVAPEGGEDEGRGVGAWATGLRGGLRAKPRNLQPEAFGTESRMGVGNPSSLLNAKYN